MWNRDRFDGRKPRPDRPASNLALGLEVRSTLDEVREFFDSAFRAIDDESIASRVEELCAILARAPNAGLFVLGFEEALRRKTQRYLGGLADREFVREFLEAVNRASKKFHFAQHYKGQLRAALVEFRAHETSAAAAAQVRPFIYGQWGAPQGTIFEIVDAFFTNSHPFSFDYPAANPVRLADALASVTGTSICEAVEYALERIRFENTPAMTVGLHEVLLHQIVGAANAAANRVGLTDQEQQRLEKALEGSVLESRGFEICSSSGIATTVIQPGPRTK